ncbi:R2D2 [Anopheles darlingi]|uniref:R2D2 n=1 Tax=Anopheles darlingi TaxID=43151 RepID=W5JWJ4_ANODA|nr:R2D2 [Anopheles darlingi]
MTKKETVLRGKTPVTMLQEICMGKRVPTPTYQYLGESTSPLGPNVKTFQHKVLTMGQEAMGLGRSKQDSKHEAAWQMIRLLLDIPPDEDEREGVVSSGGTAEDAPLDVGIDKVSQVRDICVQRNFPLPEFELVRSYGPSHAPVFEFECRIRDIVRRGSHSTKKGAKQIACQEMIKTLQAMPVEETSLQLVTIDTAIAQDENDMEKVVQTYREYSQSDNKKRLGVSIAERYKFFQELPESRIAEALTVMANENETVREKCYRIPQALGLKYTMKEHDTNVTTTHGGYMGTFELNNSEYDCFIIGYGDELFYNVYRYFCNMLNYTQVG